MIEKLKPMTALIVLIFVLFSAFTLRMNFAQPPKINSASPFNTERALARLAVILGDQTPHSVDSDANDALYRARPDWAVPQHWGDLRATITPLDM